MGIFFNPGTFQQNWQCIQVMGTKDHVNIRCALDDVATLAEFETGLPVEVVFRRPAKMKHILGEWLSIHGVRQFRCAETEKFPHVTFFFNDYREEPFEGESRTIVPSPKEVATYDLKPEMSAAGVRDAVTARDQPLATVLAGCLGGQMRVEESASSLDDERGWTLVFPVEADL